MSIGTAKPDLEEQDGIPHYFINSHSIKDEITAAQYEKEGMALLNELFDKYDQIILAGGSGMFIDALCIGLDPIPADDNVREQLNSELKLKGLDTLVEELKKVDPDMTEIIDLKNPVRVIRALEVNRITGTPYSQHRKKSPPKRPFKTIRFVIDLDRELLYDRINERVEQMIDNGLIEEAEHLQQYSELTALQTVGYQELFPYFKGEIDLYTAIEKIKQNTRRYAKRQLTWFRRHPEAIWLKSKELDGQIREIESYLSNLE